MVKKSFVILLVLTPLLLTACNNQPLETSNSASRTEQTESTGNYQTTENTQTSETTVTGETTNKTENPNENQGYQVAKELKDKIVPYGANQSFIILPSRILYTHRLAEDKLIGDRYSVTSNSYLCYYSKADKENYVYCFDPLCDHKKCSATSVLVSMTTYCNGSFYAINLKELYSFSFDGTEKKKIDLHEDFEGYTFWGIDSYDIYVYIEAVTQTGEKCFLRLNTEISEIIALTEKNINIDFFYNGKIYGYRDGKQIRCDLSFENIEEYDFPFLQYNLVEDHIFIGVETETVMENGQYIDCYYGIQTYNFETKEEMLIPTDVIGHEVSEILYADENYFYFTANEPVLIGKSFISPENDSYNYSGGKLYRVNRDGTNCICIFNDPKIEFLGSAMIYEDIILVHARECGLINGKVQTWNESIYIGTIQADGTIDKLEYIEVIE